MTTCESVSGGRLVKFLETTFEQEINDRLMNRLKDISALAQLKFCQTSR